MEGKIPYELLSLTRLAKYHDVSKFDCAVQPEHNDLNEFLKEDALKYQELGLAITYVCIYKEQIVGYVTLCSDNVRISEEEKEDIFKGIIPKGARIPKEIPAIKIARLAVEKGYQKSGIGKYLILRSIIIARDMKSTIGVRVITVESKKSSMDYYKKLGFRELETYCGKKREHPYLYLDIFY